MASSKNHARTALTLSSAGVATSAEQTTGAIPSGKPTYNELQQELRLWKLYPDACKLIKTQSEVFHAAEDDAEEGGAFVFPIIDAFGKFIGVKSTGDEQVLHEEIIDEKVRLVGLLAVVDKAPEPTKHGTFRMLSMKFALCPALKNHLTEAELDNPVSLLKKMHDIAEYLQLEKRLCERIKQLLKAEGTNLKDTTPQELEADSLLGPLLKRAIDQLAATSIPQVLKSGVQRSSDAFGLPELLSNSSTLRGALGWDSSSMSWAFSVHPTTVTKGQLFFLFGQAISNRPLDSTVLSVVKRTSMGFDTSVAQFATRIVDALVVLHKGAAALELVEEGGVQKSKYLAKMDGRLVVNPT